ncbi:hypothetical protein LTR84_010471 [Exophiala bonariae]|uniref:RING-type domain-containing protein n=1 Tax=Exophiala bonariae TaxID=1690606 RepID=A0AAV9MT89_9EURO|nr:hypothetical protein LTR84_010471 [Exophiala bonariae]
MSSPSVSLGESLFLSPASGSDSEGTPSPRITGAGPVLSPPPIQHSEPLRPGHGSRPGHPPRLPSPRLFRDFFSTMNDTAPRRQVTLPPANYSESIQDVNRALQSANRALQNAQEAFQTGRSRPDRQSLVDLTGSSPPNNSSEVNFLSETVHPQDPHPHRQQGLVPPFYSLFTRSQGARGTDRNDSQRILTHTEVRRLQEEEAILRQRENHNNWERTQARTQERRARNQSNQEQSTMSRPSSSSSSSQASSRPRSLNSKATDPAIESVDLTEVDDNAGLSAVLAKQRQDAILAQNPGSESGRTTLTAYKCPVCMETPTDATSTVCGHVFCHRCIIDTLNWSMEQRRGETPPSRKLRGVCPVCRKPLDLIDSGPRKNLVPLELKFMVVTKRKRVESEPDEKGKGKQKSVEVENLSSDDDDDDYEQTRKRSKKNIRAGKARERESTEDALWGEFMQD